LQIREQAGIDAATQHVARKETENLHGRPKPGLKG
jgi:hypothetical protein